MGGGAQTNLCPPYYERSGGHVPPAPFFYTLGQWLHSMCHFLSEWYQYGAGNVTIRLISPLTARWLLIVDVANQSFGLQHGYLMPNEAFRLLALRRSLANVLLQTCDLLASDHEHYSIFSLIKSIPLAFTNKSHQQRKLFSIRLKILYTFESGVAQLVERFQEF